MGLIIDEKIIDFALMACKEELLNISQKCSGVVACRARKDQKAAMVKLIKEGVPGTITLGIGDGANDVEMIKMAHVVIFVIIEYYICRSDSSFVSGGGCHRKGGTTSCQQC
jgi:magnesium-transporting ATPase (P-type)